MSCGQAPCRNGCGAIVSKYGVKTGLCRACWIEQSHHWTDEKHNEALRLHREEGLPWSRVAERMGLTKNQISGRMWRQGYYERPSVVSAPFLVRIQALHDAMDKVLSECKLPREVMYIKSTEATGESKHA